MGQRVFPLPDAQARQIIAAVDELAARHPPRTETRLFVRAFIRRAHQICGRVYSHVTVRKLLDLYADDYNPSSQLLQEEIRALQAERAAALGAAPAGGTEAPARRRPEAVTARAQAVDDSGAARDLARVLQVEVERVRAALAVAHQERNQADAARERMVTELAAAEAQAAALRETKASLEATVAQLLATVERTQSQADASHRHALLQVDSVRNETREARAEAQRLQGVIAARDAELRTERTTVDAMRRQISELRARLPKERQ